MLVAAGTVHEMLYQCVRAASSASGVARAARYGPVLLERLEGSLCGAAVYTLDGPNRNALGHELVDAMRHVLSLVREDRGLSVVIVRSAVPRVFCAGADLKQRLHMTDTEVASFVRRLRETFAEVERLPMPTVAAIDGAALGGGLELALACDVRVAAAGARLGLVETARGLIPGAGGTQRLPRLVHRNVAKELIYTARIIDGTEAARLGVVNHAVQQNETGDAAYRRALQLAEEIVPNAPVALRCAKRAIDEGGELTLSEGYEVEQNCYEVNIPTKDRREGMLSFIEKRKPVYEGH